ncbi:hypothetical protein LTR09_004970 [Extremus antarcticus]|uniref:Uncharacterized protein n=1 Tax=Extremus antarcticus TaxID=702011 RepID=A0AAJ0GDT9_9PEZI|nr:hypothetical protein LTR09_004970 [Extremus antarcticus]
MPGRSKDEAAAWPLQQGKLHPSVSSTMTSRSEWAGLGLLDKLDDVPRDPAWLQRMSARWYQRTCSDVDDLKVLPKGSFVSQATGYGGSFWSQTGKIDVRLPSGKAGSFFIKECLTTHQLFRI